MIESPCIGICRLKSGVCIGCFRTAKEVTKWWDATLDEKKEIVENAYKRKKEFEEN
jgi:predicted Fe-S protein YdhL (DUF1289 family)